MSNPRDKASYQALMGLVKVSGLLRKAADRYFTEFGITQTQFNSLMVLKHEFPDGCTQTQLCKKLLVHPADVTGLMKRLRKLDLIVKERRDNDERAWYISLSKSGIELLDSIENPYYKKVDSIMSLNGKTPTDKFVETLAALEEKLVEQIELT